MTENTATENAATENTATENAATDDQRFEAFKKCAVEVLSVEASQVTREARFAEDLDADSLDLVELVMALEEEFGVSVEEEELEGIETVGAAYDLVIGKISMSGPIVAVTGTGVVAPCGVGTEAFWRGLLAPAPDGVKRTVPDWDPSPWFASPKESRRADPFTQYALAASAMALEQAGDLGADPSRIGVLIGTGIGGITTNEEQIVIRHEKGDRRVSPFLVPMMMPNAAAAAVSMRYGFQGPCEATVTACAAGTHSIGNALRLIASGRCDVVLAGGSESPLTRTSLAGFGNMTALSSSGRSMPFDERRDGFVIAEGAGVLVLENLERARARGATVLALVLGAASTADAHHITAPAPGGGGAVRCMELAIADAGLSAADIVHVNAHGTSTSLNDAAEAEALAKVFGTPGPVVTSNKGVTGHALGAAGALEAVATVLSMQHRLIPPTFGLERLDPEMPAIDVVMHQPRLWAPGPTLSNSFGFGGHNGSIVLSPHPG